MGELVYRAHAEAVTMRRLGLLLIVAGCGGGKATLDRGDVQQKVAAEAAKLVGEATSGATCADVKPSGSFTCDVSFKGGGKLPFTVNNDGAGTLTITAGGDWLLGDKMEKDLEGELFILGEKDAKVDCGDAVRPVKLPAQAECSVKKAGGAATKVVVTVDASRKVDWKLVGAL